jgi:hypothetical protein
MGDFFHGWRRRGGCAAIMLAFVLGVIGEGGIRSLAVRPLPVLIAIDVKAEVSANVRPDFLWSGKAWIVSINSEGPVSIDFDGRWKAIVPAGKHRIYHNLFGCNLRRRQVSVGCGGHGA